MSETEIIDGFEIQEEDIDEASKKGNTVEEEVLEILHSDDEIFDESEEEDEEDPPKIQLAMKKIGRSKYLARQNHLKKTAGKTVKKYKGKHKGFRRTKKKAIDQISTQSFRRCARRAGVKFIGKVVIEHMREVLHDYLVNVLGDSVAICDHQKKKTLTLDHVKYALKRQGNTIYY